MNVVRQIVRDAVAIGRSHVRSEPRAKDVLDSLTYDGTIALAMFRVRQAALRWHVPFVNGFLRRAQTAFFGMEISRNAELGEGVVFLHTVGIVIGGDARVGNSVVFLGSNTLGSVGSSGYPTIDDNVVIGAGARVLGSVRVGKGASIGANAVVLQDVPPGATALGVPAQVRVRNNGDANQPRQPSA